MVFKKQVFSKYLVLSLGVAGCVILLSLFPFYESIELKLLDLRFKIRGPVEARKDIATIDIDSQALQTEGRFQDWTRDKHGRLIQFAHEQDVAMLAFDIYFPEPSTPYIPIEVLTEIDTNYINGITLRSFVKDNDNIMRKAMLSAKNVYLAQSFKTIDEDEHHEIKKRSDRKEHALELLKPFSKRLATDNENTLYSFYDIEPPIDEFISAAKGVGYAQAKVDDDGTIRRYPLLGVYDDRLFPSIVLLMICDYFDVSFKDIQVIPGEAVIVPKTDGNNLYIPISKEGFMMVNWVGDWTDDFVHYPYNLVMEYSNLEQTNSILDAIKTLLYQRPGLISAPQEIIKLLVQEGYDNFTVAKNTITKVIQGKRVEEAIEKNPDWDGYEFFTSQGLPENRIIKGMVSFYEQIKTNNQIEMVLRNNENISYDSLLIFLSLEDKSTLEWNFRIIQNYLISEGNTDALHPLYFYPPKTRFTHGGKLIAPYEFKNKILFYGLTAAGTHDLNPMPFNSRYPMIGLHANAMNTILTGNFIQRSPRLLEIIVILAVGFLVSLVVSMLRPLVGGGVTAAMWGIMAVVNISMFSNKGFWMDFLGPSLVFLFSYLGLTIYNFMMEEKDKKFLHNTFKAYLSPELIDQMVEEETMPELGGEEGFRTAFFTDIQNFSTIAETLGNPTKLVELLNEYLTAMTDILLDHKGTLDKYEGDAIIAIFGAPVPLEDHVEKACFAALAMQSSLRKLREKWISEGDKWPDIVKTMQMRIGINSGLIVTGNMGSKTRMNYTMIGDAVNIAARLESIGKQYGIFTSVSGETINHVDNGKLQTRLVDRIRVVGKKEAVELHELLSPDPGKDKAIADLQSIFQEAYNLYNNRQWKQANSLFYQAEELEIHRDTFTEKITPSQVLIKRCDSLIKNPPGSKWDGIETATSK